MSFIEELKKKTKTSEEIELLKHKLWNELSYIQRMEMRREQIDERMIPPSNPYLTHLRKTWVSVDDVQAQLKEALKEIKLEYDSLIEIRNETPKEAKENWTFTFLRGRIQELEWVLSVLGSETKESKK